jgi:hypothetical protein
MSPDSSRRRQNAGLTGPCLALSLWLIPALCNGAEPAVPAERHALAAPRPRIGRIFFSPAERRGSHTSVLNATPAAPATPRITESERLYVNGALSSSTQARTVWVNGQAVENTAVNKAAWTDRNGNVWLNNGKQGTHLVRPGQSIDRSGAIEDLLPPGSVIRR